MHEIHDIVKPAIVSRFFCSSLNSILCNTDKDKQECIIYKWPYLTDPEYSNFSHPCPVLYLTSRITNDTYLTGQ